MATIKVDSDGIQYFDLLTGERLDFAVDWTNFVSALGDTIASSLFSCSPSGLTIASTTASGYMRTVWASASAGNIGTTYLMVSKIFTNSMPSRVKKQKFRIKVAE